MIKKLFAGIALVTLCATSQAQIATFLDRAAFDAAVGATTIEGFGPTTHFPITSGVLNSFTNEAGISPGDIKAGVTYSTPVGRGNFFNIDAGGGYGTGPFLDRLNDGSQDQRLTVTFDSPVSAFGFDTEALMGTFRVNVTYGGTPFSFVSFTGAGFYGFQSGNADITSITLAAEPLGSFAFDLDNFTWGGQVSSVPEPGALTMLVGSSIAGIGVIARRRRA